DNIASTMLTEVVEDTTTEVSVESLTRTFDSMRLYPNPATDRLQCELSLTHATDVTIAIINQQGQCVQRVNCGTLAGHQTLEIPLVQLESGLYFVQVITDHAMHVRRLVRR
ncbi:MAG: T9SS type A sorting domain-containing protein, partial [Bacteroidetes bacterium]|nr:T9SS type A sorting domain-containing protein [Bacteroidota bacterium]